jgi:hypothetical protein
MPSDADAHEWVRVDTLAWETGIDRLDEQHQTAVYDCDECEARRWTRERRTATLSSFGGDADVE